MNASRRSFIKGMLVTGGLMLTPPSLRLPEWSKEAVDTIPLTLTGLMPETTHVVLCNDRGLFIDKKTFTGNHVCLNVPSSFAGQELRVRVIAYGQSCYELTTDVPSDDGVHIPLIYVDL